MIQKESVKKAKFKGKTCARVVLALFLSCAMLLSPLVVVRESAVFAEQVTSSVHQPDTISFINMLDRNPDLKALFEKAIAKGAAINPDRVTNPAQNLEEYYSFLDWATLCMPWNIMYNKEHESLLDAIDQSLNYFYFILDIPLDELKGAELDLYYPSLEYEPRVSAWMNLYTENWGNFLSSKESWNDQYYLRALADPEYGLQNDWYESKENWKSFNDFFARRLKNAAARPIASPTDNSVVAAPADSEAQGVWKIDANSNIVGADRQQDGPKSEVVIKSKGYNSVPQLLKGSAYAKSFAGGTLTHTFLNVQDYHRYHFPVSGQIVEVKHVPAAVNIGGLTAWDSALKKYKLYSEQPTWESIETRAYVIVKTEQYGLVACMPVGMSQVSSVNFSEKVKVGATVKKGDELGHFLFGGSDFVMIFQKGINFKLTVPQSNGAYNHVLMGEEFGRLSK